MKKRILTLLLAAVMLLSLLPMGLYDTAYAAEPVAGECGENVTWALSADGTLTISGDGEMYDYDHDDEEYLDYFTPWHDLRDQIRAVVVEKGVTYIGNGAFSRCRNLTTVSLPAGLWGLGFSVFVECMALDNVAIPEGVRYIDSDLFLWCTSLKTVSLPNSLTALGGATFTNCKALRQVTLPEGLASVTWRMFYGCTALQAVTIPRNVSMISEEAFSGCTALTKVSFGGSKAEWNAMSVRSGNDALKKATVTCAAADSSLKAPVLTGSVNQYGEPSLSWTSVKGAERYEFWCSENFEDYFRTYTLHFTHLDTHFYQIKAGNTYAYKVRAITADSVGPFSNEYTFTYEPTGPGATESANGKCGDSATWTLSADGTLTISGTGAMYDYKCIENNSIYDDGPNPAPWCVDELNSHIRAVVVENGITELGNEVFTKCYKMESITLPEGLKRIGSGAFWGCFKLSELTIPSTVTAIESHAFVDCDRMFYLELPGSLREIGDAICSGMDALQEVVLEEGIPYVGCRMFEHCRRLTSVTIPEGVTDIGYNAFDNCERLTSLYLPSTLKTVGEAATSGTELQDVYFAGSAAQWDAVQMEAGNNHLFAAPAIHYGNAASVPAAPTGTKLDIAADSLTMRWNAVPGAAAYKVFRIVDSTVEDYTLLGTVTGTSYTDTTAKSGITYVYMVKAVNANGESRSSMNEGGKLAASVDETLPAVTVKSAKASKTATVTVSWKKAAKAERYDVLRSDAGGSQWITVASGITGTKFVDDTVDYGCSYVYAVVAVSANGSGPMGTTKNVTVPNAPTLSLRSVKADKKTAGIAVAWKNVKGYVSYDLLRKGPDDSEWTLIAEGLTATSYRDTDVRVGSTYTYAVQGTLNTGSMGAISAAKSATVPMPAAPSMKKVKLNSKTGAVDVTWKRGGYAACMLLRKASGADEWEVIADNMTGTEYHDTDVATGVTYLYAVWGILPDGEMGAMSAVKNVTVPMPAAASVKSAKVNKKTGVVDVTWKSVKGAAKYALLRKGPGDEGLQLLLVTSALKYQDLDVRAGATYVYAVQALANDGVAGSIGSSRSVTVPVDSKCGKNVSWTLSGNGVLTVSGKGEMYDYEWLTAVNDPSPWHDAGYQDRITAVQVESGVTYIGRCAFDTCRKLTSVSLPESLRSIGQCAFNDCTGLTSVVIPEGVSVIREDAFNGCLNLQSVTLPSTLREINAAAFLCCANLTDLRLPDGVNRLDKWAFYGCERLTNVYIPATVTAIGDEAFVSCEALTTVHFGGTQAQWEAISMGADVFPEGVEIVYSTSGSPIIG